MCTGRQCVHCLLNSQRKIFVCRQEKIISSHHHFHNKEEVKPLLWDYKGDWDNRRQSGGSSVVKSSPSKYLVLVSVFSTLAPRIHRICWHSVYYFPVRLPHPNTFNALSASFCIYTNTHTPQYKNTNTFYSRHGRIYRNYKSYNANHIFAYCSFIPRIWILVLQHFGKSVSGIQPAYCIKTYLAWVYIEFSNFEQWLSCSWFIAYFCQNMCGVGIFKNFDLCWKSWIYNKKNSILWNIITI